MSKIPLDREIQVAFRNLNDFKRTTKIINQRTIKSLVIKF